MGRKVQRLRLPKPRDSPHKCPMESRSGPTLPPSAMGGDWFRVLFERSADAMTLIDPTTGRFIDCNEASAEAIGARTREEVLGLSPPSLAPEFQSNGRLSTEAVAEH